MKKTSIFLLAAILIATDGCKNSEKLTTGTDRHNNDYMEMSVLYHQQSAEIRALYYQSFNLARLIFDRDMENTTVAQPRAIIVDIDETMLDNSPYEAECVLSGIAYPKRWEEWINKSSAEALPGTLDFLNYVSSKKAEVFFVTNRTEDQREATLKNLLDKGFPFADNQHLMMKSDGASKEKYRNKISETYHISLLIGDNLSDFTDVFDKQTPGKREQEVNNLKDEFGKRFVILPNTMYGDWESALFKYNYNLSDKAKDSIRRASLRGLK